MKSNIKLGKLLCCVLLSLVMAFGNISAVFNGFQNKSNESKIYAAVPGYYSGRLSTSDVYISTGLYLAADIDYTYYQYADGTRSFYSIDYVDPYLTGISSLWHTWTNERFYFDFSYYYGVAYAANITIYGWVDGEYTSVDYILYP